MTIFIVDCSHHDEDRGPISWTRVRADGIEIVIHKASEGDPAGYHYVDPAFQGAVAGARAAGIFAGGYHCLAKGDTASWGRQVGMFLQYLNQAGGYAKGWAMIDVEPFPELVSRGQAPKLADIIGFQTIWFQMTNMPLAVYLPKWYWEELGSPSLAAINGPLIASDYPVSASQQFDTLYAHGGGDTGPGWAAYGGKIPAVWQFGSTNQVPGISGNCDCNAYKGTVEEFTTLVTGVRLPVPKPPVPAHPAWPGYSITKGMSGNVERTWQAQMKKRGWKIVVDGDYGPDSEHVCEQFQAEKKLPVTGKVDKITWDDAWTLPVTG